MTHDELLAKIDEEIESAEFEESCGDGGWSSGAKALRAVVELHNARVGFIESLFKPLNKLIVMSCRSCDKPYPCPTIQAIEKELA